MTNKELMTSHERKIAERNARFISMYSELRERFGNASNWRLITQIAIKENTTNQTVRTVLLKNGIIKKINRTRKL